MDLFTIFIEYVEFNPFILPFLGARIINITPSYGTFWVGHNHDLQKEKGAEAFGLGPLLRIWGGKEGNIRSELKSLFTLEKVTGGLSPTSPSLLYPLYTVALTFKVGENVELNGTNLCLYFG